MKPIDSCGAQTGKGGRFAAYRTALRKTQWTSCAMCITILGACALLMPPLAHSQTVDLPDPPAPLNSLPVPVVPDATLQEYVADKAAAIRLGKALYWDTRVGSDNKTSCATCHFHAGADSRTKNQVSPGLLAGDKTFQLGGANYQLTEADFPLTKYLAPPNDAAGTRISDMNDVVGSQGVFASTFIDAGAKGEADTCRDEPDSVSHGGLGFSIGSVNTRRVAPRNSPSVINSVFNFRNFWDGRANNVANGGDPFGLRNPSALVWKVESGLLREKKVEIPGASLISQASGPPLSAIEMSCQGRTFAKLGQKLINSVPLADQSISPSDSVLGKFNKRMTPYGALIKQAFKSEYWRSPSIVRIPPGREVASQDLRRSVPANVPDKTRPTDQVSQIEANFALFFGIALQLYQETLVSDDTRFDRFLAGDQQALNQAEKRGLALFQGKAKCINCHGGATLSNASFHRVLKERLEPMTMGNGAAKTYDNGFYNIGVRPTAEDIGLAEVDPFTHPMSETMMFAQSKEGLLGNGFDSSKYPRPIGASVVSVNGAFKTPGLRNVELTGPYFHNGGKATLMQVVDFYNRGGDFKAENAADLAPNIEPLGLEEEEKRDIVSFLLSLTDDRVRFERPPFDRPSFCIPDGHQGDHRAVTPAAGAPGRAQDAMKCFSEVGSPGNGGGLPRFLGLDPYKH